MMSVIVFCCIPAHAQSRGNVKHGGVGQRGREVNNGSDGERGREVNNDSDGERGREVNNDSDGERGRLARCARRPAEHVV
jgi:hypothetical protein